jgi:hypothetical protein
MLNVKVIVIPQSPAGGSLLKMAMRDEKESTHGAARLRRSGAGSGW